MAQVDFSNAYLEIANSSVNNKLISQQYLWMYNQYWYDSNGNMVYASSVTTVTETPTKYAVRYQGSFTTSGNYIAISHSGTTVYRIMGISYSPGDTFDCTIEVEITS